MQLRFEFPPLSKKVTSYTLDRYIKNIQEVQDGAAKISAIAWSHNNMKLAVCTADRVPKHDKPAFSQLSKQKYEKNKCQLNIFPQ